MDGSFHFWWRCCKLFLGTSFSIKSCRYEKYPFLSGSVWCLVFYVLFVGLHKSCFRVHSAKCRSRRSDMRSGDSLRSNMLVELSSERGNSVNLLRMRMRLSRWASRGRLAGWWIDGSPTTPWQITFAKLCLINFVFPSSIPFLGMYSMTLSTQEKFIGNE